MIAIMPRSLFDHLATLASPARGYPAGRQLFERGARVRNLYLVEHGAVTLCRFGEDGMQVVLQRAGPGDIVAEASALSERYHCGAVVTQPSRLSAVPLARLRPALDKDQALLRALLEHMGHELRHARMRAEILALKTVQARLAAWLEWRGGALPPRGNWRSLAHELGVSAEALYREIARRRAEAEADNAT